MADYTNRLEVIANIVDPITKIIPVYPVKDAYLAEDEPVFPHGIQKVLLVNYSKPGDGVYNKTIMAFDIPKITDTQYENLISVELVLQATKVPKRDVNIGFKYHTDNGWVEDGTTYLGQPQDEPEFVQMKTLGSQQRILTYDITDIFTSHNNTAFHFPITIMEEETGATSRTVMFNSREAGTKLSPVINIRYAYFPEMMDATKINGKLIVRRNVPNDTEPAPDLTGKMDVWGGTYRKELEGSVGVTTYNVPDDTVDPPVEAPYLPGQVSVMRNSYSFLEGKVTVRVKRDTDLNGRVDVNIYTTRPGSPGVDDPPARLPSDGRWVQPLPTPYLKGSVAVTTYEVPSTDPPVEAPELPGQLNVTATTYLNGKVTIRKDSKHDQDGRVDINIYMTRPGYPEADDPPARLPSDGRWVQPVPIPYLKGQLSIAEYHAELNPDPADPVPSVLDGNPEPHDKYVHAPKLDGTLVVRRNIPNDDELAPDLDGQISVGTRRAVLNKAYRLQRSAPVPVDQNNDGIGVVYEVDGQLNIKKNEFREFSDAPDLEGSINIPHSTSVDARLEIKTYTDEEDLNGQINIVGHEYTELDGQLTIPKSTDLNCKVNIIGRGFLDMEGSIKIEDATSGSYAFIID